MGYFFLLGLFDARCRVWLVLGKRVKESGRKGKCLVGKVVVNETAFYCLKKMRGNFSLEGEFDDAFTWSRPEYTVVLVFVFF